MATLYNPSIVKNGLVFYLDAANSRSYPGSGTTWTDLSGNGNNGTLTNGPSYNALNNGSIVFDGTDDYISIPNSTSLQVSNNFTINAWIYATNLSNRYAIFSTRTQNTAGCWQLEVGTGSYTGGTSGINRVAVTGVGTWIYESGNSIINLNTWTNICYVSSTNTIYVNGIIIPAGVAQAYTISNNSDIKSIGSGTGLAQFFPGKISNILLYNIPLTQTQVLQNYNATKGRYGL